MTPCLHYIAIVLGIILAEVKVELAYNQVAKLLPCSFSGAVTGLQQSSKNPISGRVLWLFFLISSFGRGFVCGLFCWVFYLYLGNMKIPNLIFHGFVQTSEVRPGSSASTGAGSSSPSGRGACQKTHETLQRALLFPTGVETEAKRGAASS